MTEASAGVPGPLGDLPAADMRDAMQRVAAWVATYRETLAERPISPTVQPGEIASRLPAGVPADPASIETILRELDGILMAGIVHWGHPRFVGYFGSTSNGPALIGEIVAAALNVSAMTWRTSPAATELESVVLSWIRQMIGLPDDFVGVVYDTASVAVLHALAAARERSGTSIRARGLVGRSDLPVFRVYASDQAHSSLEKAMILLGLGEENVIRIRTDAEYRLDAVALRNAMRADIARGHHPMAVIATVGTTSTAAVDPVGEIAALCREHAAWLHVDAAYGGALAILPEGRWAMAGTELADSVVINPHKWMFVPLDFSALFTRHPAELRAVFSLTPEYLRGDSSAESGAVDYMDYGVQLGRRFRALKAWTVFRAFGRDGLTSRIREHCRLAQCWERWVADDAAFELAAPARMSVVCFRYVPTAPDLSLEQCDRLNEAIVESVNASGHAYLTHTRLGGHVAMRVGIGNVLTTEQDLARVWSCVRETATREAIRLRESA